MLALGGFNRLDVFTAEQSSRNGSDGRRAVTAKARARRCESTGSVTLPCHALLNSELVDAGPAFVIGRIWALDIWGAGRSFHSRALPGNQI